MALGEQSPGHPSPAAEPCATMPAVSATASPLEPAALFVRDGTLLVPTIYTQGPWNPEAQHGGPVCAALAWLIESVPTLVPMQVSRFTFEMGDPKHLGHVLRAVRAIDGVYDVYRITS